MSMLSRYDDNYNLYETQEKITKNLFPSWDGMERHSPWKSVVLKILLTDCECFGLTFRWGITKTAIAQKILFCVRWRQGGLGCREMNREESYEIENTLLKNNFIFILVQDVLNDLRGDGYVSAEYSSKFNEDIYKIKNVPENVLRREEAMRALEMFLGANGAKDVKYDYGTISLPHATFMRLMGVLRSFTEGDNDEEE